MKYFSVLFVVFVLAVAACMAEEPQAEASEVPAAALDEKKTQKRGIYGFGHGHGGYYGGHSGFGGFGGYGHSGFGHGFGHSYYSAYPSYASYVHTPYHGHGYYPYHHGFH